MRILIGNPPWRQENHFGVRSGARFPYLTNELTWAGVPTWIPFPFHPAIAAAHLKNHGFEAEFWDGVAEGAHLPQFLARIIAYNPDLYLQEIVCPSYTHDCNFLATLRRVLPHLKIGAAGLMVTSWGKEILERNPAFDFGLTYEWEETALELTKRLSSGHSLRGLKGLLHRENGEIITEPRRQSPDPKKLPWPLREKLPMLRYNDDFAFLPTPNLQMYTSRGCPYKCNFCVWIKARYGNQLVRFRDPDDIIDEIHYCVERWPIKAVYFDDDTFNISKKFTLSLCEAMNRKGMPVPWAAMCRADLFDRETLKECKKTGLIAVKYGIESADQKILDQTGKNLDIHKAEEMVALTKEMGVRVHLTLMVGLPGETDNTIRKTWRFVKRTRPDYLQFSLATPYPGTDLYDLASSKGWIKAQDWSDFNADSNAVMRTEALSQQDLERWIRTLNLLRFGLQFYQNPLKSMKVYLTKSFKSPQKLWNAFSYFFKLFIPSDRRN